MNQPSENTTAIVITGIIAILIYFLIAMASSCDRNKDLAREETKRMSIEKGMEPCWSNR